MKVVTTVPIKTPHTSYPFGNNLIKAIDNPTFAKAIEIWRIALNLCLFIALWISFVDEAVKTNISNAIGKIA